MAGEIDTGVVLLDILKSVTRIEAMLSADEKEDKAEDTGAESPDPELFSTVLEHVGDPGMDLFNIP